MRMVLCLQYLQDYHKVIPHWSDPVIKGANALKTTKIIEILHNLFYFTAALRAEIVAKYSAWQLNCAFVLPNVNLKCLTLLHNPDNKNFACFFLLFKFFNSGSWFPGCQKKMTWNLEFIISSCKSQFMDFSSSSVNSPAKCVPLPSPIFNQAKDESERLRMWMCAHGY